MKRIELLESREHSAVNQVNPSPVVNRFALIAMISTMYSRSVLYTSLNHIRRTRMLLIPDPITIQTPIRTIRDGETIQIFHGVSLVLSIIGHHFHILIMLSLTHPVSIIIHRMFIHLKVHHNHNLFRTHHTTKHISSLHIINIHPRMIQKYRS